ncbi:hypothetical protein [Streptomyces sp. NRRL F-5630]|uniref:hypothetical protein n=1 Tax=Streptomyces sp. NRRL F-5630 TaxID=1463864 RepID=UPI003D7042B7
MRPHGRPPHFAPLPLAAVAEAYGARPPRSAQVRSVVSGNHAPGRPSSTPSGTYDTLVAPSRSERPVAGRRSRSSR